VPTFDMVDAVIGVANTHGPDVDKFAKFGLTPGEAMKVGAPLVAEYHASFECRLADGRMIDRHSLFIFEVVSRAWPSRSLVEKPLPRRREDAKEQRFAVNAVSICPERLRQRRAPNR
jgi:flavin reductase (DIM6/NTAB) family NADH-FMN oxidoreductase RutF